MSLANLALTNTFNEWRIRTNQLVTEVNDINANTIATFVSNNAGLRITTSPIRKGNVYLQLNVSTVTSDTASFNLASALSVNLVSNNATFANTVATTAYNQANAANVLAFQTGIGANSFAATAAGTTFDKANSANILAFQVGGAVTTANLNNGTTFDKANAANILAFTANVTANYANVLARSAYELASLAVGNNTPALALSVAQSAFGFANTVNITTVAAFGVANAALPNSTVTLNGSLLANAYVNTTSGFYSVSTGTALRPAYSWTTDNFTGMYRVGANTVGFSTAAASRLVIDANGFVGIGTTTPSKLLEISGGSSEVFSGVGSISGNVLTISSVVSGQINVGHYITDEGLNVLGGTYVKEYFGGTGGLGTYNLTASQATVTSTTIYAFNMHNNTFRITGTDTIVNPGQPIGMIEFASNDSDLTSDEGSRAFVYAVNEQANAGATLMFGTAIGSRESTEKLRINRFGAVGIGGANFGTAGQKLQSNGSSSAPLWVNDFAFDKANAANVLAFNTGIGANAFASATVAGANTAVGAGANAFMITVQNGSNTAVGTGANTYLLATIAGANTAVGTGANTVAAAAFAKANATTYTSNVVISVADNTNAALTITQTGTGDALRVEDSSNPDSTPTVIDGDGNVIIGGLNPLSKLDVVDVAPVFGDSRAVNTTKNWRPRVPSFAGISTFFTPFFAACESAANILRIGGGTSAAYAATAIRFFTAGNATTTTGTERMVIDSNGNVGMGTIAPAHDLEITKTKSGENTELLVRNPDTGVTSAAYAYVYQGAVQSFFGSYGNQIGVVGTSSAHPFILHAGASERMRITNSGNVGIGTATPVDRLHVADGNIKIDGRVGDAFNGVIVKSVGASASAFRGGYVNTHNENDHAVAGIEFDVMQDGSGGVYAQATPSGARTSDRRRRTMGVDCDTTAGRLYVVGASGSADTEGRVELISEANNGTRPSYVSIRHRSSAASGDWYSAFIYNGNLIGKITQSGTTGVAYGTTSDYRLKGDVTPMTNRLAAVMALNPVTYTWHSDGSAGQGFIAHELQAVIPDAVAGTKDAEDADGNPVYQGVDFSRVVPTLVAAVQEQQAQIAALTARIEALENAA